MNEAAQPNNEEEKYNHDQMVENARNTLREINLTISNQIRFLEASRSNTIHYVNLIDSTGEKTDTLKNYDEIVRQLKSLSETFSQLAKKNN